MALNLPNFDIRPDLYNGGAVQFDYNPIMRVALMNRERQEARDKAMDAYTQDMHKQGAGLRPQDQAQWFQNLQQWKNIGKLGSQIIANPSAYKKPVEIGGVTYANGLEVYNHFNSLGNGLMMEANQSKQRVKDFEELARLKREGKWNPTDRDNQIVKNWERSIYDKGFDKGLTFDQLSPYAAPYDAKAEEEFTKAIVGDAKRGETPLLDKVVIDKKAGKSYTPISKAFSPEQLRAFGDNAGRLAGSTPTYDAFFNKQLHDPAVIAQLTPVYKQFYPDGGELDSPQKLAAAYAISKQANPIVENRAAAWKDVEAEEKRWRARQDYQHKLNEAEIRLRQNLQNKSTADQQLGIDKYLSGLEQYPGKVHQIDFLDKDGKKILAKEIPASASLLKSFERLNQYGQKVQPRAVYYENGNYYPIFPVLEVDKDNNYTGKYKTDANGNPLIDKNLSKSIRRQDVKVNYSNTILPPKMVAETLDVGEVPRAGAPNSPKATSAPDGNDNPLDLDLNN